jgi:hypothetical protein
MTYDMSKCVLGDISTPLVSASNVAQRKKNFREYYYYAIY